jgi:hypothetical protein
MQTESTHGLLLRISSTDGILVLLSPLPSFLSIGLVNIAVADTSPCKILVLSVLFLEALFGVPDFPLHRFSNPAMAANGGTHMTKVKIYINPGIHKPSSINSI